MTVAELIARLQELDPNMPAYICCPDEGGFKDLEATDFTVDDPGPYELGYEDRPKGCIFWGPGP